MANKKYKTAEELEKETTGAQADTASQTVPQTPSWRDNVPKPTLVAPTDTTATKQNMTNTANALNQFNQTKAPSYAGTFQSQLDDLQNQIMNGQKFEFDMNNDALYQQYRDLYQKNAQKAMEDTMGQAAMLTGGYGNSYAVTAGNQAYNNQMDQLNAVALDIYDRRYNEHRDNMSDLYNRYALLQERDATEYSRSRDDLSDYERVQDDLYQKYLNAVAQNDSQAAFEYQKQMDELEQRNYEAEVAYQKERDKVADSQWQKQYDRSVYESDRDYNRSVYESDRAYNYDIAQAQAQEQEVQQKQDNMVHFQNNIASLDDFKKRRNTMTVDGVARQFDSYKDYVRAVMEKWYYNGDLGEDEVTRLKGMYDLD